MDTNKIFIDMAQRAHEFAEMCERMANETKQKADPEAWRENNLKKQAAGVRFERRWMDGTWHFDVYDFNGPQEDYREVPQEVQKDGGVWIPEAAREILKGWHKQGLKFNCCEIFLCLEKPQFSDRREYYTINKQPIPSGMSVETVEAMWRQGLRVEYNHHGKAWRDVTSEAEWNMGLFEYTEILQCLRIPAQPIPEKLLEEPQEVSASECQKKALEHLAKTYSADKGTAQLNPTIPLHAAERALWKAQREAGTNEVWITAFAKNGAACEIPVHIEPGWHDGQVYYVKPMKLTAKIARREVYKTPYDWEFTGTREEYRAECHKYGYAILSEIKEVVKKPKTVKYYFAMLNRYRCTPFGRAASDKDQIIEYAKTHRYTIIGDIEEREVEA